MVKEDNLAIGDVEFFHAIWRAKEPDFAAQFRWQNGESWKSNIG
jgi:hypothetical protein